MCLLLEAPFTRKELTRVSQSPLVPTHNAWSPLAALLLTRPAGVHWHQLGTCCQFPLLKDGTWSLLITPLEGLTTLTETSTQRHPRHPQVMTRSVRHQMNQIRKKTAHQLIPSDRVKSRGIDISEHSVGPKRFGSSQSSICSE